MKLRRLVALSFLYQDERSSLHVSENTKYSTMPHRPERYLIASSLRLSTFNHPTLGLKSFEQWQLLKPAQKQDMNAKVISLSARGRENRFPSHYKYMPTSR